MRSDDPLAPPPPREEASADGTAGQEDRRRAVWGPALSVIAVLVLAVVAAIGGSAIGRSVADARSSDVPATLPGSTLPPSPEPRSTPTSTPEPMTQLPDTCAGLYSDAVYADLSGWAKLNADDDRGHAAPQIRPGIVADVLWNLDRMQCDWYPFDDFHELIGTTVAAVSPVTLEGLNQELQDGDFSCETHRSGTLCSVTDENPYLRTSTIYLREGVIIATGMSEVSYEGYLDDIIDTVWGGQQ